MTRRILTSVTRIADLTHGEVATVPRSQWSLGDYVVAEVLDIHSGFLHLELPNGRMIDVLPGDEIVGAFGDRYATLEATGTWQEIGDDGCFSALTGAGLFGVLTSKAPFVPDLLDLAYVGHVHLDGRPANMADFALPGSDTTLDKPVILIVGSSMSAGKTATARLVVRRLKALGKRVVATKLTGAARYRDVLSMKDVGADEIYDFVDAGLPSTVVDDGHFRRVMGRLLGHIADRPADVVVVEAGASPLEPYNGEAAYEMLKDHVVMSFLCASDPYAVLGISTAFHMVPDVVTGPCTNTRGGVALIERLTRFRPMRLLDERTWSELDTLLCHKLGCD